MANAERRSRRVYADEIRCKSSRVMFPQKRRLDASILRRKNFSKSLLS
jgi:hypothetical protein